MRYLRKIAFVILLVLTLSSLRKLSLVYSADEYHYDSQKYLTDGNFEMALLKADKAIRQNPNEPNYYRNRARVYLAKIVIEENRETIVILKYLALSDLQTAFLLNPRNLVTVRNIVPLYYFLALDNFSTTSSAELDPEFLVVTAGFYESVRDYAPNDAGYYSLLAKYQKRLGLDEQYNYSVQKIKQLRPDLLDWFLTE